MTDLKVIARKIAVLMQYTIDSGCRTSRSQAELLRDLDAEQTVTVLEMAVVERRKLRLSTAETSEAK